MNEIYLTIMFFVIAGTILACCFADDLMEYFMGTGVLVVGVGLFGSFTMLVFSGVLPLGEPLVDIRPATNTRVGDELIIQANGFPTQTITDIALIDKQVQVKKTTPQNAWGGDMVEQYTVEEVPVIEKP